MCLRIALVVHRYGQEVNGGAEYHCRVLAEHLAALYQVDVLTSCALDSGIWDNYYPAGTEVIDGITVYRFPVERQKDGKKLAALRAELNNGDRSIEMDWIAERGPYCPKLLNYLQGNADQYQAVIFFTFATYLTVAGIKLGLDNSILLPTAHDEPDIYLPIYDDFFQKPGGILYNSIEEKEFLENRFHTENIPSRLTCFGIDIPEKKDFAMPESLRQYKGRYIVYVGRVSGGKNFRELNKDFIRYKKNHPSDLKLIVVGQVDEEMELIYSRDIIYAGFVTEEEKTAIIKNAELLVNPSLHESLSIVILESMAVGTPILVNGKCAVLKGQCIRSNAGLYYEDYLEFEAGLNYIVSNADACKEMAENGLKFVENHYKWDLIVNNVVSLVEEIHERKKEKEAGQNGNE